MGSEDGSYDESPQHRVYLSPFEMAQAPVTNRDYAIYLKKTKVDRPQWFEDENYSDPEQPVVGVNWYEAEAYCKWLSKQSGHKIRLPTEAEFEKAARGGHRGYEYPWGNDVTGGGYPSVKGPLPAPDRVARGRPNGYGLHDMVYNIRQWCLDGYDPRYYEESPENNPRGSNHVEQRVARGASWKEPDPVGRCAARSRLAPYFRCDDFGFRWVRTF